MPPALGERYHVGGARQRFPNLVPRMRAVAPLRGLWHRIPLDRRRAFALWYTREVNVVPAEPQPLSDETRHRLADFYRADVERLERLLGRRVPWSEFS